MFSWICPRCGHDNPPSATKCLSCGTPFDEEPVAAETPPQPASQPAASAVTEAPAPNRNSLSGGPASRSSVAPSRSGIPTWLLTLLWSFAIVGVCSGIYLGITYFRNRKQATTTGLDSAANVARTKLSNPLQRYVEVVGIRLLQDPKKKPEVRFVVVNHSPNELDDLSGTVTLWASTSRSEEDSVGTFQFKIPALAAYSAKEMNAPLSTKLKFYELPDWQNATPEIQITSP